MENGVSLKEYFESQLETINTEIVHVKELMRREKELIERTDGEKAKALVIQFSENERRLTALNHEAQRLALMVPRVEFELVVENLKKENRDQSDQIKVLELWKSNSEGRQARSQLTAIVSAVIALAALLLSIFN